MALGRGVSRPMSVSELERAAATEVAPVTELDDDGDGDLDDDEDLAGVVLGAGGEAMSPPCPRCAG